MKALKITRCSDSLMWYCNHVNAIVPLLGTYPDEYLSREPSGLTNIVKKQDAVVIEAERHEILYLR
jgi:hypothetical protein